MRLSGCPICRLAVETCRRMLDALFYEHINDPHMREELLQTTRFCAQHVKEALQAGHSLGGSIIYSDILRHVAKNLVCQPSGVCPACGWETRAAAKAIETLLEHIGEKDVRYAYVVSDGLCLPHLRQALQRGKGAVRAFWNKRSKRNSQGWPRNARRWLLSQITNISAR
ncbi:MAG: DUF6062 family protein [Candidatus Zipacnadales bacterium]